jgi:hypothetical protein
VGAQSEHHAWNPRQGRHSDQKGHCLGLKGPGPKASRSSVHVSQQPPPFWTPNDVVRYNTEELLSITAQYATNKEAARPLPIPGGREAVLNSNKAVSSSITVPATKKDAKSGKKRQKWRPQWVAATADYDNDDKKADNSDMECVRTAWHFVKHQA